MDTKRAMTKAIKERKNTDPPLNRININKNIQSELKKLEGMTTEDFVTTNTHSFFVYQGLSPDYLDYDPETWSQRDDFRQCMNVVNHARVVNDNAERGVALT